MYLRALGNKFGRQMAETAQGWRWNRQFIPGKFLEGSQVSSLRKNELTSPPCAQTSDAISHIFPWMREGKRVESPSSDLSFQYFLYCNYTFVVQYIGLKWIDVSFLKKKLRCRKFPYIPIWYSHYAFVPLHLALYICT